MEGRGKEGKKWSPPIHISGYATAIEHLHYLIMVAMVLLCTNCRVFLCAAGVSWLVDKATDNNDEDAEHRQ